MSSTHPDEIIRRLVDEFLVDDRIKAREEVEKARGYLSTERLLQTKQDQYTATLQMQGLVREWTEALELLRGHASPEILETLEALDKSRIHLATAPTQAQSLQKTLQLSPDILASIETLARVFFKNKQFEESSRLFLFLVALAPATSEYWMKLGIVYQRDLLLTRAAEAFSLSLLLDPTQIHCLIFLAHCSIGLGWKERARQALDEAQEQLTEGMNPEWQDLIDVFRGSVSRDSKPEEIESPALVKVADRIMERGTEGSSQLSRSLLETLMTGSPPKTYLQVSPERLVVHHDPSSDWAKRTGVVQFPKSAESAVWDRLGYREAKLIVLDAGRYDVLRGVPEAQEGERKQYAKELMRDPDFFGKDVYLVARDDQESSLVYTQNSRGEWREEGNPDKVPGFLRELQLRLYQPVLLVRKSGFGAGIKRIDLTRGLLWVLILGSGEDLLGTQLLHFKLQEAWDAVSEG